MNINKQNDLINERAKLDSDKIDISIRNSNRNTKAGWKCGQKGQIKKLREQVKERKNIDRKSSEKWWQISQSTQMEKINEQLLAKDEIQKITEPYQTIHIKEKLPK